jgi:hypothetical protein
MSNRKTNNSFLKTKIILRLQNLPDKQEIKVLDCFAGDGAIWHNIKLNTEKKIIRHAIDEKEYSDFALIGNNIKVLQSIDLSTYDVIDLDAYGVPCEQIEIVMDKAKSGTIVFYTFIQSFNGALPNLLFDRIGITEAMYSKCRSIFNKGGHKYFLDYLGLIGVEHVKYYQIGRKTYGVFVKTR